MRKADLIEHTFDLQKSDLSYLLFLRVILDVTEPASALEQDIHDLYRFPERLESSYRQEWSSYIKRQLVARAFQPNAQMDAAKLMLFVEAEYAKRKQAIDIIYHKGNRILLHAESLIKSPNVSPIKTPLHDILATLMRL